VISIEKLIFLNLKAFYNDISRFIAVVNRRKIFFHQFLSIFYTSAKKATFVYIVKWL